MPKAADEHVDSTSLGGAHVLVLLCTYNEVSNLPRIFTLLDQHLPKADVLVVDDNSPDGTAKIVERWAEEDARFHLMQRSGKLGLGSALRDGMRWCLAREYDFLMNLDADLSHDPAATPAMLESCMREDVDVAVGSRYVPGGGLEGLSWHRRLISRCLNGYATRILRLPVSDCSGSFRCYSTSTLRTLNFGKLTCNGYGFLEEILVTLHRGGARLAEVPVQFDTRYSGKSKLGISDIVGALRVIHSMALSRRP